MMSLSGDSVKIKLGKLVGQKRGIILDRINFGIALFKDICSFGLLDTTKISHNNKVISNVLLNTDRVSKKIPIASLVLGIDLGSKIPLLGLIATIISLISITLSSIWQKKLSKIMPLAESNF